MIRQSFKGYRCESNNLTYEYSVLKITSTIPLTQIELCVPRTVGKADDLHGVDGLIIPGRSNTPALPNHSFLDLVDRVTKSINKPINDCTLTENLLSCLKEFLYSLIL